MGSKEPMYGVGIIGTGLQFERRASAIKNTGIGTLKAVSSGASDRASLIGSRHGCIATSADEMVADPTIDIIIICTTPETHARFALASLEAGKHVLIEKPLAMNQDESVQLVKASKRVSTVAACGFNHRFHPGLEKIKSMVASGAIGEPLLARSFYGICGRDHYSAEWRSHPSRAPGGLLMELGIHVIDFYRWVLGDFKTVFCERNSALFDTPDMEDQASIILKNSLERHVTLTTSLAEWKNRFFIQINGTEGLVRVAGLGGGYGVEEFSYVRRDPTGPFRTETTEFRGKDTSWDNEWRAFVKKIETGESNIGTLEDGAISQHIVRCAYQSSSTRMAVAL